MIGRYSVEEGILLDRGMPVTDMTKFDDVVRLLNSQDAKIKHLIDKLEYLQGHCVEHANGLLKRHMLCLINENTMLKQDILDNEIKESHAYQLKLLREDLGFDTTSFEQRLRDNPMPTKTLTSKMEERK